MKQNLIFNSLLMSFAAGLRDVDGNLYNTVTIGGQEWIVENLRTTKYGNGKSIYYNANPATWGLDASSGSYCVYNNDPGNLPVYGYLYNWYSVNSSQGLSYFKRNGVYETGWKIPSDIEWNTLAQVVGGPNTAGGVLKEVGLSHWFTPNTGASDNYGFKSVPGGYRDTSGNYNNLTGYNYLWSCDESSLNINNAWFRYTSYNDTVLSRSDPDKNWGFSVRCMRNTQGEDYLMSFMTDASENSFDPTLTPPSGTLIFNLGDASYNWSANGVNHFYKVSGRKNVKIFKGTSPNSSTLVSIDMQNDDIVGTLDLSRLTNLSGNITLDDNLKLTQVIFPNTKNASGTIDSIRIEACDITGVLDLSTLTNWKTSLTVIDNTKCTKIIFPDTSALITTLYIYQNNFSTIDLSGLTGLGGSVNGANNYNMTSCLLPNSSQYFNTLCFYNCDIVGSLDLRSLTGGIKQIQLNQNRLSVISLADTSISNSTPIEHFDLSDNKLAVVDVSNKIFRNCTFSVNQNPSLYVLRMPDVSCDFTYFSAGYGKLNGVIDVSKYYFSSTLNLSGNYDVSVVRWDILKMPNLQNLYLDNTKINGTLDVSSLTRLKNLKVDNTKISNLLLPKDASELNLSLSGTTYIHGVLDISMLWSVNYLTMNSVDVSIIRWPYNCSNTTLNSFEITNTNFTGVIDISLFKNIGGSIKLSNNPKITNLRLPNSPMVGYGGSLELDQCNLTGTLDISTLGKISSFCHGYSNSNLQTVIWPTFEYQFMTIYWQDCSLTQSTINNLFSKLDTFYTANPPYYDLNVDVSGAKHASPTGGSSNANIIHLQTIFSNAGRTLTLRYNL